MAGIQKRGEQEVEQRLESAYEGDATGWSKAIKRLVDHIHDHYKQQSRLVMRKDQNRLTPANYFKNAKYIAQLMAKPIPHEVRAIAHFLQDR